MSEDLDLCIVENSTYVNDGLLQFSKMNINEEYCKKWNIREKDFICLSRNGQILRNTLYRIGGMGTPKLNADKYFMLIKHVEAFYSDEILKMCKSKDAKHLEGKWTILDKEGNEKVEFANFDIPYLVKDSCIYSLNNKYYNIETGEFYGDVSKTMESTDYLFLDNKYDKDKSKRGVIKIDKKTGSWELFY